MSSNKLLVTQIHDSGEKQVIPFDLVSNRPIIPVYINKNGPYEFGIDIGATGIGRIDDSLVSELGLEVSGTINNFDGIKTRETDVVGVKSIAFGSLEYNNVDLMTRDYSPKDGLLGRGFFSNKLLTIDYRNQKIILSDGKLSKDLPGVLSYDRAFHVNGKIGEIPSTFYIDSGSSESIIFPKKFLTDNDIPYENTGNVYKARRANTIHDIVEAKLSGDVTLGNILLKNQLIVYSDITNRINLGGEVLKKYSITIDQQNKLILFSK